MPIWLTILVAVVGSSALFGFFQFMISRHDNKKKEQKEAREAEKKNELLEAVQTLTSKIDANRKESDERFNALEERMDEERATNARIRILDFSDEIMHGVLHSEESFNQVLQDITDYDEYCEKHPNYKNARAKVAIANIQHVYENCVRECSFLGMTIRKEVTV